MRSKSASFELRTPHIAQICVRAPRFFLLFANDFKYEIVIQSVNIVIELNTFVVVVVVLLLLCVSSRLAFCAAQRL